MRITEFTPCNCFVVLKCGVLKGKYVILGWVWFNAHIENLGPDLVRWGGGLQQSLRLEVVGMGGSVYVPLLPSRELHPATLEGDPDRRWRYTIYCFRTT